MFKALGLTLNIDNATILTLSKRLEVLGKNKLVFLCSFNQSTKNL
jgi:hypothetical protein